MITSNFNNFQMKRLRTELDSVLPNQINGIILNFVGPLFEGGVVAKSTVTNKKTKKPVDIFLMPNPITIKDKFQVIEAYLSNGQLLGRIELLWLRYNADRTKFFSEKSDRITQDQMNYGPDKRRPSSSKIFTENLISLKSNLYRGTGTALMHYAYLLSVIQGCEGRMILEATTESSEFYLKMQIGMACIEGNNNNLLLNDLDTKGMYTPLKNIPKILAMARANVTLSDPGQIVKIEQFTKEKGNLSLVKS